MPGGLNFRPYKLKGLVDVDFVRQQLALISLNVIGGEDVVCGIEMCGKVCGFVDGQ
jgi:hypothetical protein